MIKKFTLAVLTAVASLTASAQVTNVSDLAGQYTPTASGEEYITAYAWTSMDKVYTVDIADNTDGTVTITNLLDFGEKFVGTVDLSAKTITIEPTVFATYYTLANTTDTTSVVATFDDAGTITFENFSAYWSTYEYMWEPKIVLTKESVTPAWTAEGVSTYYNGNEAYHSGKGVITKYEGSSKYQYGVSFDGASASPSELYFRIEADSVVIANGEQTAGYTGGYFYYVFDGNSSVWLDYDREYASFSGDETGGKLVLYHWGYPVDTTETESYEGLYVFVWGTENGISEIDADVKKANSAIYDLSGRRVAKPTAHGIYISGGKKFVVK